MWMEHEPGRRVNGVRMQEIARLAADVTAVACPFCLLMLDEAATNLEPKTNPSLKDIAEIVVEAF
jgi:Fe-S oxidoreductase